MVRKPPKGYLLTAVSAILLACVGDPYSSSYTMSKPHETDLVGKWVPDKNTVKDMRDRGGYPTEKRSTSLTLKPDGTFEMVDMPDWWREPLGRSHGRLESDSGTWNLKDHAPGTWWEIEFDFPKWWTSTPIRGEKPPYLIHFRLGDPDSGNAMTFVKQGPPDQ